MLAKRLIHNLSVSMDAEENMINRLKVDMIKRLNNEFNNNTIIIYRYATLLFVFVVILF